jgi:hypothetical protein
VLPLNAYVQYDLPFSAYTQIAATPRYRWRLSRNFSRQLKLLELTLEQSRRSLWILPFVCSRIRVLMYRAARLAVGGC